MAIEPGGTGAFYIDALNERWPLGSDEPSSTDDHLRLIKNVLKNTFPNVDGPVTQTQEELNSPSIPSGSVMLFYMKNPPTGWSKVSLPNDFMVRLVSSTGGSTGGTHSPTRMDKVPVHTHGASGSSGNDSHNHGAVTGGAGAHSHTYLRANLVDIGGTAPLNTKGASGETATATSGNPGNHSHSISSDTHNHSVTVAVNNNSGSQAGVWEPRYANVIVCSKD